MKKIKNILLGIGFLLILICAVVGFVFLMASIEPEWKPLRVIENTPSYSQGYFDGMNSTIDYLYSTDQMTDSAYIELEYFINDQKNKENKRMEDLNE